MTTTLGISGLPEGEEAELRLTVRDGGADIQARTVRATPPGRGTSYR
jgi:hypothetical protein